VSDRVSWSRRKKFVVGLGVSCGLLCGLEAACRIAYRDRWPYYMVFDEELLYRPRPGWKGEVRADAWAQFNSLGLREAREVGPKQGTRVLVLGDSIAYGYGLDQDQTISQQLERQHRAARPEAAFEALNAGVPGYGPEQETTLLRRLAPELEPDVVVLLVCLRNDISVEPVAARLARDTPFNPGLKRLAARDPRLRWLLDHSALAFWLGRKLSRQVVQEERAAIAEQATQAANTGLRFSSLDDFLDLPPEVQEQEFAVLLDRLQTFAAVVEAHDARALVVLCPEQALLDGTLDPEVVTRVSAIVDRAGLPCLDLLPNYLAADVPLLREKDGVHPNAEGARRIAGWILSALE
jgi:lysophospholipase L1-like esterase